MEICIQSTSSLESYSDSYNAQLGEAANLNIKVAKTKKKLRYNYKEQVWIKR